MNRREYKVLFKDKGKKAVGVVLTRCEVVYDVEFVLNRIAKVQSVDDEGYPNRVSQYVTIEGDENKDYVDRQIMSAVKEIRRKTTWASGDRGGDVVMDTIPEDMKDWTFVFNVPKDWMGEADVLCSLCHNYVKNRVIGDWLKMVAPRLATSYETEANDNLREISVELRKEPPRMPPRMFNLFSMK